MQADLSEIMQRCYVPSRVMSELTFELTSLARTNQRWTDERIGQPALVDAFRKQPQGQAENCTTDTECGGNNMGSLAFCCETLSGTTSFGWSMSLNASVLFPDSTVTRTS